MGAAYQSAKFDNDYDPHLNRNLVNGLTHLESLMHVIKGCMGTGILALPEAFYFAGVYPGLIGFFVVSLFGTYCFHVMVRSQYLLCKTRKVGLLTYPEAMEVAFEVGPEAFHGLSHVARQFTNVIFIVYQIGVLIVYIIFCAVNLEVVVNHYLENKIPLFVFTLCLVPPFLFVICLRNLKILAPFSIFANIVTFVTIIVIAYYVSSDLKDFDSLQTVGTINTIPLSFGTALFALLSVPVIISVENAMDDGKFFLAPFGTLNVGFGVVIIIYAIVGMMGFWRYSDEIYSTITLNFPPEDIQAQIIRILYCLAIIVSYGLNGIVPIQIIWAEYINPSLEKKEVSERKALIYEYILRLSICFFTFALSLGIPLLGPIISLVGGFCLSCLGIIFPALMEMFVLWDDGFGKMRYILWKDIVIMVIGLIGMSTSMYAAILDIVTTLQETHSSN